MTDMFLERQFDSHLSREAVLEMVAQSRGCFSNYRVEWLQSFLSSDGRRLFCWFRAPDAESVRQALRQSGENRPAWAGTVHDAVAPDTPPWQTANVLVRRRWEEPVAIEDIQAIEDAGAQCLENYRVRFLRTFFSRDRMRMVCLYAAPDAESVRLAQRQAGMPVESVWAVRAVRDPGDR
jgi:hypothetical protein